MREDSKELLAKALTEIRRLKAENAALKAPAAAEPIAVVGMACRFPQCPSPEAYWSFLAGGRSAIQPTPADRAGGTTGTFGSYLEDADQFDAAFFGISPKEAQSLDPQQRLLLELAWHAFESGNIRPDTLAGREIGVFVGMSGIDYALKLFAPENRAKIDPYFGTGSTLSPAAGRLSYFLKVNGPSMVVDTACSSSLVAIHLASESLRRGECEAALVAGVNRILGPDLTINFAQSGLLSSDGKCYTFDERAQGYSRGEGGGALVLKRLRDAEAAGDTLHALILGSAVNQDGGSGGLTVPSGPAQQKVVRRALSVAGLSPADVDYVETHGTATPLGDPIEAHALSEVFAAGRTQPLAIGSAKTNFGHLEAAAGMASSFKVIQSLRHEALPAHLNFSQPSSKIAWAGSGLRVVDTLQPWPRNERRRVAGVSGFGFAGTNAHIIFAEAPKKAPAAVNEPWVERAELLVLSAKTPDALRAQATQVADRLEQISPTEWSAAAWTSQTGRFAFAERLSLAANNPGEAVAALRKYATTGKARGVAHDRAHERLRVAFVFTGQGAQYAGMGRKLYAEHSLFREIVDACAAKLQPELGRDIRDVMFAEAPRAAQIETARSVLDAARNGDALAEIDRTAFTQAGLFVIEYALARLWESWGVKPEMALGHSVGEYAAACIAGVLELDDALKLIAARGRLMEQRSQAGAMLTVFADEEVVARHIAPHAATVSIAAVNGPGIVLVSGAVEGVRALEGEFEKAQLRFVRMRISHAFHSPLTEPALPELEAVAATLALRQPRIPLISNVTGGFVGEEIAQPAYWSRHLRQSVRFCESMTLLHAQKLDFLVEIGPDPTLVGLDLCFRQVREQAASTARWVSSLKRGQDDLRALLENVGRIWSAGAVIAWSALQPGRALSHIALPGYPYQRKRHWFDFAEPAAPTAPVVASDKAATDVASTPAFTPAMPESVSAPAPSSARRPTAEEILAEVQAIISEVSGLEPADLPPRANLLEMGLDSLMFVRAGRTIEKRFEVKISIKQFYEDLHRIGPLVDFLSVNSTVTAAVLVGGEVPPAPLSPPVASAPVASPQPIASPAISQAMVQPAQAPGEVDAVMQAHFRLMERYLELRREAGGTSKTPSFASPAGAPAASTPTKTARVTVPMGSQMAANFGGINLEEERNLSPQQRDFLRGLIQRLTAKTQRSKTQTQAWRRELADWKGSLQFKRTLKELKYPIVSDRSAGSRIWDIDGNEYVDLALGMGVHFLGHAPAYINEALHRQIERTAALGPQSDLAGDVARKICQITGAERASLAITGSGAVMLAQRLARAVTGKPVIAQFGGAYHGIGSEVLVVAGDDGSMPLSPGIPRSVVENAQVLDYGSEESLEWIREHAAHLAAVIVEPVQSRRPGFQPHRFLRRLRQLTEELGIALIFDEMINGFRIEAGGAQAWFGIEADLVTYGKIVGGGMPLAAVAGKAKYLDWIDGGFWQYGDDSAPTGRTIFTGGTHNRHPLALAAANAALDHIIASGPALYEAVNRRTERLAKELNAFLETEAVSFRVAWFGSQFRFEALGDAFDLEVLFYLLTEAGFYTWEQRICCLSTAHTDEEIDRLIAAVKQAVAQMRAGGFAIQAGPAAPRRVLPLSPVQERLYALCQREGAEMPYHLSGVWELSGKVDAFRLQDAFQEVVRRHESLRTAFGPIAGKPCQYVIEEPRFFLERVDAAGRSPDAVLEAFVRPFDLEHPPLLRVGYAALGEERGLLLIDVHHIAADGLSMNVILREFAALYDGQKLRPVKRQYRHAIDEAEQRRATPDYRAQEEYWLAQMRGEIPALELPTDFPRTGEMDFRGGKCLLRIDAARTRRLEVLARERGASLYMVLMGVFATLLHRLTEAEDVIVGLPVAGRPGADSDDVVGMFVNSLPLRFRPRADQPFAELLREVRGVCLGAYDNSEYAFGELVARLDLPRNPDRNPLFDAMFAYENADERVMRTRDLAIRTIDQYEGSGMFDLSVDIIREAGALNVRFHYATRLFRADTVERWSRAFSRLVDAALAGPELPVGKLPLLSVDELEQVSARFNAPSGDAHPPTTLVTLWEDSVRQWPEAVAVVSGERRLSYRELDALATRAASRLVGEHRVAPGDLIALLLEPSEHMIAAILGVLKAGAAYVPIDPANPAERIRALVKDARAKVLIADSAPVSATAPVVTVEALFARASATSAVSLAAPLPESLAYVIYTSGSTGLPKGVLIEHRGIANSVQWRCAAYGFTAHDVTLQMPSYAFDASLLDIFSVLVVGGRLVLVDAASKRDLTAQAALMQREGITNLLLTPSLHALYLQEIGAAMTTLRFVCVAGEATSLALVRKHFERLPRVRLFNEYGPTENSVVSTFTELQPTDTIVTIGRPVAGNRLHVLQQNGERCGIGVIGELVVSGVGLARGYLERPELTAAVFAPAPWDAATRIYRTGDLARWLPDGTLEFFGRRDGQVKLRGYRIELGEIEDLLQRQPGITAVAAKVVTLGSEQQLAAYVTAGGGYDEAAVRAALQSALPVYMVPTLFVRLESMPLNISGKIDRRALPVPSLKAASSAPPRGPRECVLAEVWSEVLRHSPIGRDDDYFRLGGDSIKGIQIISRLLQRGWRLDMRWLFRHPTIAGLAPQLQETRPTTAQPSAESAGDIPLSAIQSWFFRTVSVRLEHFNQAVWLIARDRWKVDALSTALRQVAATHAAFRTRYRREHEAWRQAIVEGENAIALRTVDLRGVADAGTQAAELVRSEQGSLDLARGPLSRAAIVHFDGEDGLLWVVHHLAVDGVSWRILLEDLSTAYAAACAGKSAALPAPSASFATWTRSVQARLAEGAFDADAEFWRRELAQPLPKLPQDRGGPGGTVAALATLTRTTPSRLGAAAHGAYRTRGIELYLAALRLAYSEWSPGEDLLVLLEGHGREASLADIDVGRTVGWFTSVFPLRFGAAASAVGQVIRETKERVRRVPRHGASFGWLRESGRVPGLADRPQPEISFNFLGDLGGEAGAGFALSPERPGHAQDPQQALPLPISLYGYAADGRLYWTLDYDGTRFAPEGMRMLLDRFVAALDKIAEQAAAVPAGIPSPVDFTLVGLELAAFDRMVQRREWSPQAIEDIYGLSPMQQGLYYEALNAPASDAYFEQMSFRLEGISDLPAFVQSWSELVARHAALRTVFVQTEAGSAQVVFRTLPARVAVTDISGLPLERQRGEIESFKQSDRRNPFVLDEGPLMRVQIFQLGRGCLQVVWSHHHIVMDGWCVGILYEDLMRLYAARAEHREAGLETPANYREYICWLETLDRGAAARYWREELAGYDTLSALPRSAAAKPGEYRYRKDRVRLEGPAWAALQALAAESGATTATLLQTLWGIVLARYNRTSDVVFGGIVSGRPEDVAGVERMVGLFINALPVRLRFAAGASLSAELRRFQLQAIERRPYEHVPLAEIKEQAPALREIFDHLVVLENYPMEEELRGATAGAAAKGPRLSEIEGFERTHYDFTLVAVPLRAGLEIEMGYNEAVYPVAQMRRVQAQLLNLVAVLAAQPKAPCLDVDWLPSSEVQQLEAWTATAAAYPAEATIVSLFAEQAAAHAMRPAVTAGGISRTYAELDGAVRRLALRLHSAGVRRGDRVAVWLPRDADMVVTLLATLCAGGCYVPLDPEYPDERLKFILEDSGARVVVARSDHRSPFPALHEIVIDVATEVPDVALSLPQADDAAYIIYTSGSTGKPKGCLISHRNVVRLMRNDRFDFQFGPDDVWIVAHSFCFDFSVWEMYGALLYGGRVVVAPREEVRDVRRFVELVARERVTVLNQTPAAFYGFIEEALLRTEHDFGAHLRYVVFGGDRLEPHYLAPWAGRYGLERPALINMYGITETTVHVTFHRVTEDEVRAADGRSIIGRPLPETQVWVLDPQRRLLPIGAPGELYVGGTGVGLGYLNRAELTAERFIADPRSPGQRLYKTGDVGRWREDGQLEYLGRNDHQVQVRGFRVELGEVEAACLRQPGIEQAVVLPFEPTPGQLELIAYLVGSARHASEMRAALAPLLPTYMIPGYFEWVTAIPLTSNGKIDRKALPTPGAAGGSRDRTPPRNATETALLGLWREVLGLEAIGIHDNFFDLGGQSLKAVRLRAKLEDSLNFAVTLRDLFARPTIAELAELIGTPRGEAADDADLAALMESMSPEELEAHLRKLET